jgi:hypothetical protein
LAGILRHGINSWRMKFNDDKARIPLGLFSQSGFTREVESLGEKGEVELVDIRKIAL